MNLNGMMGDWSTRDDFRMEDDLSTLVKTEDLAAIDPYPFYPILDGASDMCTGKPGDGCDVCGRAQSHLGDFGLLSCPAQLPLLDWSDVEDQLGEPEPEPEQDEMRCVNINQIFNMPEKPLIKVEIEDTDNVISDCMWSSSSAHRMDMSELGTSPLPALSVENDVGFSRPDMPQTDSESHYTDSDDLIQRVPKQESFERRLSPVPEISEKPPAMSGRSLLKRNQFSLKVARAPHSKPSVPSPTGDSSSSYSGDHSYSATSCIGILTPSPSPSESSSGECNRFIFLASRHHPV